MTSITFFLFFIPVLAFVLLAVNLIFAPHNPYKEKNNAFECGFTSFMGQNRTQFSISFFIFALLFLLFDLEILLVYPYLVSSYVNEVYGLFVLLVFLLALTLGFAFELGKKALTIDSRQKHKPNDNELSATTMVNNSLLLIKTIKNSKNIKSFGCRRNLITVITPTGTTTVAIVVSISAGLVLLLPSLISVVKYSLPGPQVHPETFNTIVSFYEYFTYTARNIKDFIYLIQQKGNLSDSALIELKSLAKDLICVFEHNRHNYFMALLEAPTLRGANADMTHAPVLLTSIPYSMDSYSQNYDSLITEFDKLIKAIESKDFDLISSILEQIDTYFWFRITELQIILTWKDNIYNFPIVLATGNINMALCLWR